MAAPGDGESFWIGPKYAKQETKGEEECLSFWYRGLEPGAAWDDTECSAERYNTVCQFGAVERGLNGSGARSVAPTSDP